jgi:hypothetical protein
MNSTQNNVQLWNFLLLSTEKIEALAGQESNETINALIAQLNTITEAFAEDADPVDNYEAYVMLRLSHAISNALDSALK